MMNRNIIFILVAFIFLLSCYHNELQYSYTTSYGGIILNSSYYYLAEVKEFKLPKGVTKFPDGGHSKITQQFLGLFSTDTITKSTILVAKLGVVSGWPSRYSTRIDRNQSYIAFGIINVTQKDSIDGIYLYNLKKEILIKYSPVSTLPSISPNSSRLAYCDGNKLTIDDYQLKLVLTSYMLHSKPAFVNWKNENEILIFYANPFRVDVLNISTGKIDKTDLKYLPNFNQELDATQINRVLSIDKERIKEILVSNQPNK